jgi:taurine dioxygenase
MLNPRIPAMGHFGYQLLGKRFCRLLHDQPQTLLQTALRHCVLHVRELNLSDPWPDLERVARVFGSPVRYNGPVASACIEMANSASTPEAERNKAVEWHQDDIHTPTPASFTMLYCLEAPRDPPATRFSDLRRAFDDLDPATRTSLRDLRVRHDPLGGAVAAAGETRGRIGHEPAAGVVTHPLVLDHPRTGLRQLFAVAGTADGIPGMADRDGHQLLRDLKRHATQEKYLVDVHLGGGSFLIWDNLAVLHTATALPYSDLDGERRRVLRVSVR